MTETDATTPPPVVLKTPQPLLTLEEALKQGRELVGFDEFIEGNPNIYDLYTIPEIEAAISARARFIRAKGRPPFVFHAYLDKWLHGGRYRSFLHKNGLIGNIARAKLVNTPKPKRIRLNTKAKLSPRHKKVLTFQPQHQERNTADFYPTPGDTVQGILDFLNLPTGTTIWEPACGAGHVAKTMQLNGYNKVVSSDLFDYGFGEPGVNFLYSKFKDYDWIVTNPPFNLAAEFIEKAFLNGKPFAFLLKATYWQAEKRRELFQRTKPTHIVAMTFRPEFNFGLSGKNRSTMDCMWCIWGPDSFNKEREQFTDYCLIPRPKVYPFFDINAQLKTPFQPPLVK